MWLRLLKSNANIGQLVRPQLVDGKWRAPVISGRRKAELKGYFEQAGVPWIYDEKRPEVHTNSAYNRRPKPDMAERNFEAKLAMIRKNLSNQEERIEKMRQDRLDNAALKGLDRTIMLALKGLNIEAAGGKKSAAQRRAAASAEKEANKELGIQVKKRSPAKKGKGTSRGGTINKKTKASFELSGASLADAEEGKGYSTNAAREIMTQSKKG